MYITILVKQVYWYISQVSGERLQDHWSSGLRLLNIVSKLAFPDVNECSIGTCLNDATCENTQGSYVCNCTEGWTDRNCQTGRMNRH